MHQPQKPKYLISTDWPTLLYFPDVSTSKSNFMRKLCILLNMLFIITAALLFNACRKDPYPKPPKPQPKPDWLLSYVGLSYSVEPEPGSPGSFEAQAHYFYYKPSGKPWVHSVINRTFGFVFLTILNSPSAGKLKIAWYPAYSGGIPTCRL